MPRSELIKFRLSGHAKARISRHAERSQKSVAALMRDLTAEAIIGRSANEAVRADMAVFRQLGNTVLGIAEEIGEDHRHGAALRAVGQRLRDLSSRHIVAMR